MKIRICDFEKIERIKKAETKKECKRLGIIMGEIFKENDDKKIMELIDELKGEKKCRK